MHTQKIIEQLGYTAKEAKVYLAVLSMGESHITDIAEKVKMPRSSVQSIVDKLQKDGLMTFYVMRRYKYWVAENPERILATMKKREESMREAMPHLTALRRENRGKRQSFDPSGSLGIFHVLADTCSQPMLIANGEIEIEYVNAAWEEQFGYTLEEVRGQNPHILKSGKTPDHVYKRMWKALNEEKMFQSDEIINKRKDGSFFNLLTTIFHTRHNGNVFFIQILEDITGQKDK